MTSLLSSTMPSALVTALEGILPPDLKERITQSTTLRKVSAEPLRGDGSARRLWRIFPEDGDSLIVIAPENRSSKALLEARSGWQIGRHLLNHDLPIAELVGYDEQTGLIVVQDLGDSLLHDVARATDFNNEHQLRRLRKLYRATIENLVSLQIDCVAGFSEQWCWDSPVYDYTVMRERESSYYYDAFWKGLLGQGDVPGLEEEFQLLAAEASEAPVNYFMHRDFQSRNVMIHGGEPYIIDYQGGRLGPLGYDLASLLIDPYAALPAWLQDELYVYYLQQAGYKMDIDQDTFQQQYNVLKIQRHLQMIGAFSFLSKVRGKQFFAQYIQPALQSLIMFLDSEYVLSLPVLLENARKAEQLYSQFADEATNISS